MSPGPEFGGYQSSHAMIQRILQNTTQILHNTEAIMSEQAGIDADVTALTAVANDIDAQVTQLGTDVTALQAAIGALPAGVDTSALDAVVASLAQRQAALDSSVSTVTGLVPPAAPPSA